MGPLPQKIGIVIDLGYARHDGGERLQAEKEKLIAGQKGRLWRFVKEGAAEGALPRSGAFPEIQSLSESRESRHSRETGELLHGRGAICYMSADASVLSRSPWHRRRAGNGNDEACDPHGAVSANEKSECF